MPVPSIEILRLRRYLDADNEVHGTDVLVGPRYLCVVQSPHRLVLRPRGIHTRIDVHGGSVRETNRVAEVHAVQRVVVACGDGLDDPGDPEFLGKRR